MHLLTLKWPRIRYNYNSIS
uniref:Uncharacterized protein n=1 Tax=Anguilla anguilla TaxID=7936 RepID=A0A0E9V7U0_ANGAN